ncbi:MAG: site-specific integrase [Bryobacteraceae bacterium]
MKVATLQRRLAAIGKLHRAANIPSPASMSNGLVSLTWRGIRRTKGVAQTAKMPILVADLRRMMTILPEGLTAIRDRSLLLLGFAGAFRRSELVSLNVEDLDFQEEGLVVSLRRSKTDQEGEGRKIGVPYGSDPATCPYRSTRFWLKASSIQSGPLFRAIDRFDRVGRDRLSDRSVALIVKRYTRAIGKDASQFSGHSLRSGLVTAAVRAGASERSIMAQTGHRSVTMVRRYIRDASLFMDNAAATTGL